MGAAAFNRIARFMMDPRDLRSGDNYFEIVGTMKGSSDVSASSAARMCVQEASLAGPTGHAAAQDGMERRPAPLRKCSAGRNSSPPAPWPPEHGVVEGDSVPRGLMKNRFAMQTQGCVMNRVFCVQWVCPAIPARGLRGRFRFRGTGWPGPVAFLEYRRKEPPSRFQGENLQGPVNRVEEPEILDGMRP